MNETNKKIIKLIKDNREIIMYLIFGVLTTAVNVISYYILTEMCFVDYRISNVAAWFLSVLFAFITNRKYVFSDNSQKNEKNIFFEASMFYLSRALTGGLDYIIMVISVDFFRINETAWLPRIGNFQVSNGLLMKILSNIIVIILNYILSKFIIFKKGKKEHKGKV